MRINDNPADLFSGVDHQSFDKRNFDPTRKDIENICRFFSIGKLQNFQKDKDIIVSHSNFFVFVATTRGQYALKFYPKDAAKTIAMEYAINRFLIGHHFPTPAMHAGHSHQSSFASNDLLAACYSYINGLQAWQCIKKRNIIRKINATMVSLKNILFMTNGRIPFLKQENFTKTINTLIQTSRAANPYDQKIIIEVSIQDACRIYKTHQSLFKRQWLHNNTTLTNLLVDKEIIYTLDLSHIREDYALSDLASLVISCLFLKIPQTTIRIIIDDYIIQHKMTSEHLLVLNALIKIGLIKEYFKNVQREKSINLATYSSDAINTYMFHLSARKKLITTILKNRVLP